jgi:hypothetical protein
MNKRNSAKSRYSLYRNVTDTKAVGGGAAVGSANVAHKSETHQSRDILKLYSKTDAIVNGGVGAESRTNVVHISETLRSHEIWIDTVIRVFSFSHFLVSIHIIFSQKISHRKLNGRNSILIY